MGFQHILLLLAGLTLAFFSNTQPCLSSPLSDGQWKFAVMPFQGKGISEEESKLLTRRFIEKLLETGRFDVMSEAEMFSILEEANFTNLSECTYTYCIAHLGKVLGVERVLHGNIQRRGKLYTLQTRVIAVSSAEIVHNETAEYSGEFNALLTNLIPELARGIGEKKLKTRTFYRWYFIGAVGLGLGAAIYFLHKTLNGDSQPGEGPPHPDPD